MKKNHPEIKNLIEFLKSILNKKRVMPSDLIFHSDEGQIGKVLILTNFSNYNINNYIKSSYKKNIRGLVIDREISKKHIPNDLPVYVCKYLSNNMNLFLSEIYDYPLKGKKIIGVTGTDGKTSIIHLLAQTYKLLGKRVGIISTDGNGIYPKLKKTIYTTPRSDILYRNFNIFHKKSVDIIILEASSQGLHQGRLLHINFDISIVTNITKDHLDYHKTYLSYIKSKCILLNMTRKIIFLNKDCKNVQRILNITSTPAKFYYYDSSYKIHGHKTKLLDTRSNRYNLSLIYNILKYSNISDKVIISIFERLRPIPGRNNIIHRSDSAKFIIDYAHTRDAFECLLKYIHETYYKKINNIIVVFGCGGDRDQIKREEMGKIANKYSDIVILTNDNPRGENPEKIITDISKGITNKCKIVKMLNRKNAIKHSVKISKKNDIVVIAGKGNEDSIIYKKKKIKHNDIDYLKSLIS